MPTDLNPFLTNRDTEWRVVEITRDLYDPSRADPHTIYMFSDDPGTIAYGNHSVPEEVLPKRTMSIETDKDGYPKYVIWMPHGNGRGIRIKEFYASNDALDYLQKFASNNTNNVVVSKIRRILENYTRLNIGIGECIIGIMAQYGVWGSDPRIQDVTYIWSIYGSTLHDGELWWDLPDSMQAERTAIIQRYDHNPLVKAFFGIYDVLSNRMIITRGRTPRYMIDHGELTDLMALVPKECIDVCKYYE